MVGVNSGSRYRRTYSLSCLAWSWVGGRLAPFYIHQMNWVNSRNGSAMNIVLDIIINICNVLCLGYTSGSDLQGEATMDSHEDSRESRGDVLLVENYDKPAAETEWPETTLSSKQPFLICNISADMCSS